jgi:hypothetical protein
MPINAISTTVASATVTSEANTSVSGEDLIVD